MATSSPSSRGDAHIKTQDSNGGKAQLEIGTDVSAKYRGAWCEGKVIKRQDIITCKVVFENGLGTAQCKHMDIKGTIALHENVMAIDPKSGRYAKASIQKMSDGSLYTVRFPDGDERTLKRNAVTLMGPQHFNEGYSLGSFPMTDPDEFVAPASSTEDASRKRRRVSSEFSPVSVVPESGKSSEKSTGIRSPNTADTFPDAEEPTGMSHQTVLVNPIRDGTVDGQFWWPALIVPAAEVMRDMIGAEDLDPKVSFVVRFFEDNLYAIIPHMYVKQMQRHTNPFEKFCKMRNGRFLRLPAVQRALRYLDDGNLPSNFKWKTWSDKCDKEAAAAAAWEEQHNRGACASDKRWNPNPIVERNFNSSLYEYMARLGTPIKRTPSIGFKDLDLYKLYTLVARKGGYEKVSELKIWRELYAELVNQPMEVVPATGDKTIRAAYEKYLLAYERQIIHGIDDPDLDDTGQSPVSRKSTSPTEHSSTSTPAQQENSDVVHISDSEVLFGYEIGAQARCTYKDGKRYSVVIEDRRLVSTEGTHSMKSNTNSRVQYRVHYQNWARRYDQWVPANRISDPADTSAKKRPRAREDRKEDLAISAAAVVLESENIPVGESFVAEQVVAAAAVASVSPPAKKTRKSKAVLSDEELAQSLALAEVARVSRRRETRRSANATNLALTQQKNALLDLGTKQVNIKEEEAVVEPGVSPTRLRNDKDRGSQLTRISSKSTTQDRPGSRELRNRSQARIQLSKCYVPSCIVLADGWRQCYACACTCYRTSLEKLLKNPEKRNEAGAPALGYKARFQEALHKKSDEPIAAQLEFLQELFMKHSAALRLLASKSRRQQRKQEHVSSHRDSIDM